MEAVKIDRLLERSLAEKEKKISLRRPEVMGGCLRLFYWVEILECQKEGRNKGQMQAVWEIL